MNCMTQAKCLICNKLNDNLECDECKAKSVKLCEEHHNCSECKNQLNIKNFYVYKKNGKPFNKCKSCFNKKVKCEICNKEINKTYKKRHDQICKKKYGKGLDTIIEPLTDTIIEPLTDGSRMNDSITNRTLIVGPCFCGKTFLIMKILKDKDNVIIITHSPKQYKDVNYTMESPKEIKDLEEYEGCCVVFDDMLDHNQKEIEPFFTRGRHENIDVYYLSQSYFALPLQTIRNNSNIIILFKQTRNGVQHIFDDIAGLDMNYDEWKWLCGKAWEDDFNYLQIDRMKKNSEWRYTIRNANSNSIILYFPQTKPF